MNNAGARGLAVNPTMALKSFLRFRIILVSSTIRKGSPRVIHNAAIPSIKVKH